MTRNYQIVNYREKLSASILCNGKCGNHRDTGVPKKIIWKMTYPNPTRNVKISTSRAFLLPIKSLYTNKNNDFNYFKNYFDTQYLYT